MSIFVGGRNDYKQILQRRDKKPITTPTKYTNEFNDVSLFVYNDHALTIGEDHTPYTIGNNNTFLTHPENNQVFQKFFGIHIKYLNNQCYYSADSAVTGYNYSLYLTAEPKDYDGDDYPYLLYVHSGKKKGNFAYLDTQGYKIISIYGGRLVSAAIDECGSIHIITDSILKDKNHYTRVTWLPEADLPVFIAFQGDSVLALSSRGYVYEYFLSELNDTDYFHIVKELRGIQCVSISGINDHVLVAAKNGTVYGRGSNKCKQLSISEERVDQFVTIKKLSKIKIQSVFAGDTHSFFVDDSGVLYTCGSNEYGESLIANAPIGANIEQPTRASIPDGVKFVIASTNLSVVFLKPPPMNNSNMKIVLASPYPYPMMFFHDSNDLMERLVSMEEMLRERDHEISLLKMFMKKMNFDVNRVLSGKSAPKSEVKEDDQKQTENEGEVKKDVKTIIEDYEYDDEEKEPADEEKVNTVNNNDDDDDDFEVENEKDDNDDDDDFDDNDDDGDYDDNTDDVEL